MPTASSHARRLLLGLYTLFTFFYGSNTAAQSNDKFHLELPSGPVDGSMACGHRTAFWTDYAEPEYLIVYFHALNSHEFEPFGLPSPDECFASALRQSKVKAALISIDLSPEQSFANCDVPGKIDEPIRKAIKASRARKILIYGGSMGGYRALTYLGEASEDILSKIHGVIAIEPPDNLEELVRETSLAEVQTTVEKILTEAKPPKTTVQEVLHITRSKPAILIISALSDTVVPSVMQHRLKIFFEENGYPTKMLEMPGNHKIPNAVFVSQTLQLITGENF